MTQPFISIITVSFNAEDTIEGTIKSVSQQSYENIEYLVIDGLSTDSTMAIVSKYENHIKTIVSEKDDGIYEAMNKGLALATGEYVLFLNADDTFACNDTLSQCADIITQQGGADIVYGSILQFSQKSGHASLWNQKLPSASSLYRSTIPHPSTLFNRARLLELEGFDESYRISGDYDLFVRAFFKNFTFKKLPILVTIFSTDGLSNNSEHSSKMKEERTRAIRSNFPRSIYWLCRLYTSIRI